MSQNTKVIKIATFNLLNLVLPNQKYYDNQQYSTDDYEKKVEWIVYQLKQMDADIVGFQEVFHKAALQDVLNRSGIYTNAYIAIGNEIGTLPRLAIVSRFPIEEVEVFEDFLPDSILDVESTDETTKVLIPVTKFSRPVLKVKIKLLDRLSAYVYVVHLKSKRPMLLDNENRDNPLHLAKALSRSLIIRTAEATALRGLLMQTLWHKKEPVIVMGDVNDSGLSVTTRIISGEPPHRRLPHDVKRNLWDVILYHVKDIQARRSYHDFYYTHIHNGHYESLDHIMVSEELVTENPLHVGKVGYVSLLNDHLIDQTLSNEKPKRWKTDHGIVVCTIELLTDKI